MQLVREVDIENAVRRAANNDYYNSVYWYLKEVTNRRISKDILQSIFHEKVVKVDFSTKVNENNNVNEWAVELTRGLPLLQYLSISQQLPCKRIQQLIYGYDCSINLQLLTISNLQLSSSQLACIAKAIELNPSITELRVEAIHSDTKARCYPIFRGCGNIKILKVNCHRTTPIEIEGLLQLMQDMNIYPQITDLYIGGMWPNIEPILENNIDLYNFGKRLFSILINVDVIHFNKIEMNQFYAEMNVPEHLTTWYARMSNEFTVKSLKMV